MSKRIWPGDYFDAAGERLGDAQNLYKQDRFGFALYTAGLSIECILRAFRTRKSVQFDEKHDLVQLFDGCDKQFFGPRRRELDAAINAAWKAWRNDYRFSPNDLIESRLNDQRLSTGIEGDPVKFHASQVIDCAVNVYRIGRQAWRS